MNNWTLFLYINSYNMICSVAVLLALIWITIFLTGNISFFSNTYPLSCQNKKLDEVKITQKKKNKRFQIKIKNLI